MNPVMNGKQTNEFLAEIFRQTGRKELGFTEHLLLLFARGYGFGNAQVQMLDEIKELRKLPTTDNRLFESGWSLALKCMEDKLK